MGSQLFPTLPQLSLRFQPPLLFPPTTLPLLLSPPTTLPLLLSPPTTLPPLLSPLTTPFLTPATLAPTLDTLASLDTTGTSLLREKLKPRLMHTLQPRLLRVFLMPMLWLLAMPTTLDCGGVGHVGGGLCFTRSRSLRESFRISTVDRR